MRYDSERAKHYREKAERVRAITELLKDLEARQVLMSVVADYLMLATFIEQLQMQDPLPASE